MAPIYDIRISSNDWQEGLRLPIDYTYEVAVLFGFYWSLASPNQNRSSVNIVFSAEADLHDVLFNEVQPLAELIHNISMWDHSDDNLKKAQYGEAEVEYREATLTKSSLALSSFLINEHNFPNPIENRKKARKDRNGRYRTTGPKERIPKDHLPNLPWTKRIIDGFIIGYLIGRGHSGTYHCKKRTRVKYDIHGNGPWAQELHKLLTDRRHSHCKPQTIHINKSGNENWVISLTRLIL